MTYARSRLYLGITGVGIFVLASAAALFFNLPRRAFLHTSTATALALTLALYILISLPLDLAGGHILPRRFNRTRATLPAYLSTWFRGVVLHAAITGLCASLIFIAATRAGTRAGIGVFFLLMLCLLQFQLPVARLIAALKPAGSHPPLPKPAPSRNLTAQPALLVYHSSDPAFVGGLIGVPGAEKLVLPAAWLENLPADTVSMQLLRRSAALVTGARTRGIALALLWNLAGFSLATQCPRASLISVPGLIATGLWFTLWSFLGLLLLPTLNRPGVLEADRFAIQHGVTPETLQRGIIALDRLQDDEPHRSRWIERVFHPIPSVAKRMQALNQPNTRGAWQGARMTLYLSWACFGFLSRVVHCNSGRPELWVLFPGD